MDSELQVACEHTRTHARTHARTRTHTHTHTWVCRMVLKWANGLQHILQGSRSFLALCASNQASCAVACIWIHVHVSKVQWLHSEPVVHLHVYGYMYMYLRCSGYIQSLLCTCMCMEHVWLYIQSLLCTCMCMEHVWLYIQSLLCTCMCYGACVAIHSEPLVHLHVLWSMCGYIQSLLCTCMCYGACVGRRSAECVAIGPCAVSLSQCMHFTSSLIPPTFADWMASTICTCSVHGLYTPDVDALCFLYCVQFYYS